MELSELISTRKDNYNLHLANKLVDPTTSSKTYWSILKTFYNGRKIPIIKLQLTLKRKPIILMFFVCKYTLLINNSVLPDSVHYTSTARFYSINFINVDILKIIKSLNANKAHGHSDISNRMIKLCGQSIVKHLAIIFKNCIDSGIFPDIWKKSNI